MVRDISRGDLPTLIMAVLADHPAHGYAIARTIEQDSAQMLRAREGSLYPALRKLEQQGLIQSSWDEPESGPARKVYALTNSGREELARRAHDWQDYVDAVVAVLQKRTARYA